MTNNDLALEMRYTINLNAPLETKYPVTLLAVGDNMANVVVAELKRGAEPADLNGLVPSVYFLPPSGGAKIICWGTVEGNVARIPLTKSCYNVPGMYVLSLVLTEADTGQGRTVLRLVGTIEGEDGPVVDPSGRVPTYEQMVDMADQMDAALEEARGVTEDAIKATLAANEGEIVRDEAETTRQKHEIEREAAESKRQKDTQAAIEATNEAAQAAINAAEVIDTMTLSAAKLPPGSNPTVTKREVDGHVDYVLGLVSGDKGDQGEQGDPYIIVGDAYPTLSALEEAVTNPSEGVQYNVGTGAPYNVYRWTGTHWEDQGKLQGPSGSVYTPSISPDGVLSFTNNGGLLNPEPVDITGQVIMSSGMIQAVEAANEAAGNADKMATLAEQKAALANTAATSANEAATSANEAAASANEAAASANEAAASANEAAKVINITATLTAAGWTGSNAPYTQVVSATGMTASKERVMAGLAMTATAEQVAEASKAMLLCTAQGAGTVTVSAFKAKPGIDIPILIRMEG